MIELLISIAIVAVLAAIAVPSYYNYIKKADFSEIVMVADSYRNYIGECISRLNTPVGCNGGRYNIPDDITGNTGSPVKNITVVDGAITITPNQLPGMDADTTQYTYVLTPTLDTNSQVITWGVTGEACKNNYVECKVNKYK